MDGFNKKLRVPKQIVEDLKFMKRSKLVDMFDYDQVSTLAYELSLNELVEWLDNHPRSTYQQVLFERLGRVVDPDTLGDR